MATALVGGLCSEGWAPSEILVLEPNKMQRDHLLRTYGVHALEKADASVSHANAVVWAVKPQSMNDAASEVAPLTRDALHISIAAGVTVAQLRTMLGVDRIVRSMPNLPAVVRAGVTGLFAPATLSSEDRSVAERILGTAGQTFWVPEESRMNAVTAVSGSGPGYVFHFLEGFQQAAEEMDFTADQARSLVLQVVQGALDIARNESSTFEELRSRVSSKGGTTAAGTLQLDLAETQKALIAAVRAAYDRGVELGT